MPSTETRSLPQCLWLQGTSLPGDTLALHRRCDVKRREGGSGGEGREGEREGGEGREGEREGGEGREGGRKGRRYILSSFQFFCLHASIYVLALHCIALIPPHQ